MFHRIDPNNRIRILEYGGDFSEDALYRLVLLDRAENDQASSVAVVQDRCFLGFGGYHLPRQRGVRVGDRVRFDRSLWIVGGNLFGECCEQLRDRFLLQCRRPHKPHIGVSAAHEGGLGRHVRQQRVGVSQHLSGRPMDLKRNVIPFRPVAPQLLDRLLDHFLLRFGGPSDDLPPRFVQRQFGIRHGGLQDRQRRCADRFGKRESA